MKKNKLPTTKLYYSIGEVAKMLHVSCSLLRFWEIKFPAVNPRKTSTGFRHYTQKDIELLQLIHYLVKEKGMTLDGARMRIASNRDKEEELFEAIQQLKEAKEKLLAMRKELDMYE